MSLVSNGYQLTYHMVLKLSTLVVTKVPIFIGDKNDTDLIFAQTNCCSHRNELPAHTFGGAFNNFNRSRHFSNSIEPPALRTPHLYGHFFFVFRGGRRNGSV